MVSQNLAQKAYAQTATIRSPRTVEYEAFAKITHQLKTAAQQGKSGFAMLASALHENRKLWTLLATNVADPDNALPESLRAQLFYLAEFTHQHSAKVLTGKERVRPLIDVNMAVLRGLRDKVATL